MIDYILLVGRILFVVLLYLFLFAIMKTGIGLVKGQRKKAKTWELAVERGPKELRGVKTPVRGPVVVGRAPGSDILIGAGYVSARHARFTLKGNDLFVEDLNSTNGTAVNGRRISEPVALRNGDVINIGDVSLRVRYE